MRKTIALALAISAAAPAAAMAQQNVMTRAGNTQFWQAPNYEGTGTDAGGTTFYQDRHGRSGTCTTAGGNTYCDGATPYTNE